MEVIAERDGPLPGPLDTLKLGKVLGRGGFAVRHVTKEERHVEQSISGATAILMLSIYHLQVVYRGTLGAAQVAVKCLLPADPAEPTGGALECKLFLDEARLMIALDHRQGRMGLKAWKPVPLPESPRLAAPAQGSQQLF